jgi:hypothetical protein
VTKRPKRRAFRKDKRRKHHQWTVTLFYADGEKFQRVDDHLLEEAQKIGRHRTKRETVSAALEEYIAHRKQQEILTLFGKIDYDRRFDYQRERKSKRL